MTTEFAVVSDAVLVFLTKDMPGQTKTSQKYPAVWVGDETIEEFGTILSNM